MALVPPLELPAAAIVAGKLVEVMLMDSTHPAVDPPLAQVPGTPTNSQSVLCPEL